MTLHELHKEIKMLADPDRAKSSSWFFKTGEGQYGYGDVFIGLTVPQQRIIAKKYKELPLSDIEQLLTSKIHEERLIALFILVTQFGKAKDEKKKEIYNFYLSHTKWVNNWDLVDSSADKIVGEYLRDKPKGILTKLAVSESIWERRIAIIATYQFIKCGDCAETFLIAKLLLKDKHDLIHKAVGWMLREAGKRCSQEKEEDFLKLHYKTMPRTMLRYAIERFPPELRRAYMEGKI
jgi:3-methyladenine DNA glycosylase AlkD